MGFGGHRQWDWDLPILLDPGERTAKRREQFADQKVRGILGEGEDANAKFHEMRGMGEPGKKNSQKALAINPKQSIFSEISRTPPWWRPRS
jgi:hypothetical protein